MCDLFTLNPETSDFKPECLDFDCSVCTTDDWTEQLCCGYTTTDTVAAAGLGLAFVVRPVIVEAQ
jgi:hypothetical protein